MNANSENNSDKEKDAEIAASQLVEMMRQQALYERIVQLNATNKSQSLIEEPKPLKVVKSISLKTYLKWTVAASVLLGLFMFFLGNDESPEAQIASVNVEFRGTKSLQSRSVINGQEIRTEYADIDDLIDAGKVIEPRSILEEMNESKKTTRKAPVNYRLGIIAFKVQDYAAAAKAFRQTVDSSDMEYLENAYWNLLLTHRKLKDMDAVKMVVNEMIQSPHITIKQKKDAQSLVQMEIE